MKETLHFLTEIQPPRTYEHIQTLDRVAKYIKERFENIGLEVSFQEFEVDGCSYRNVIAILNPQYDKRLLFGGHYDVCGEIPGADDNASAVAGIIESARLLYPHRDKLPFRVEFIAFVLEEPPYFDTPQMGSYIHAKSLHDAGTEVVGLINYEMIGYFSDEPGSQEYPVDGMEEIYGDRGNYIAMTANPASAAFLESLNFASIDAKLPLHEMVLPDKLADITASDHLNYWHFGFDAIMVTDTAHFRNPHYHEVSDTMETLNIEKMGYVVEAVAEAVLTYSAKIPETGSA